MRKSRSGESAQRTWLDFRTPHFRRPHSAQASGLVLRRPVMRSPVFPLAAFLEHFHALKALEHIPFAAQGGRRAQTAML